MNKPGFSSRWKKPTASIWTAGILWLAVVVAGTVLMMAYANTPGRSDSAPATWPKASGLSHSPIKPTLVMFVHPQCPCSRASIGELSVLMAHCQNRVDAHVCFIKPAEMTAEWVQSDSWRSASQIPGVVVSCDDDGREARCFGAETSGDTELFGADGRLLFHGGITASRGHFGDNDGLAAVEALLFQKPVGKTSTPVFGCSLFSCEAADTSANKYQEDKNEH